MTRKQLIVNYRTLHVTVYGFEAEPYDDMDDVEVCELIAYMMVDADAGIFRN